MQVDIFTKVEFPKLDNKKHFNKGTVAKFYLKEVPNLRIAQYQALRYLWNLTSLLASEYSAKSSQDILECYLPEGNDCWIRRNGYSINIDHKYWTTSQINAFKDIVKSLAFLNKWQVVNHDL